MCHSQRLGDPPLRPWISIKLDGEVVCAHCTCMAGVGEACSHIGATLFALETSIKLLKNTACTSMPCEWLRPSAQKIETARFTTAATTWGCEHETEAVTAYETIITTSHTNVSVSHSPGLHIKPCFPHLGASPDAIIECSCHGRGMVEVKCPYCKRGNPMEDAADDPKFCLQKNSDGVLSLKTSHQYYYQVQTQLFVSGLPYCDCVVFSGSNNIFIQRIVPDNEFWEVANAHVLQFYISGILPELVGKWYTRLSVRTEDAPPADTLFCYCRKPATDVDMLVCCEATCKIGRYHRQCLGLKTVPKRLWQCPDCRKLAKKSK